MGYETRLYIVEKFNSVKDENEKCYSSIIARFDMCKFYALSDVLRYKPEASCYFYADDGNTKVLEDCYGEPLKEATIKSVIDILEKEVANGEDYWRIFHLLSALKSIEERLNGYENIVVLHYGY